MWNLARAHNLVNEMSLEVTGDVKPDRPGLHHQCFWRPGNRKQFNVPTQVMQ